VPTSAGYGASLGGVTALLGMLASCAAGLTVVGIDNGFGAACAVLRMLGTMTPTTSSRAPASSPAPTPDTTTAAPTAGPTSDGASPGDAPIASPGLTDVGGVDVQANGAHA
jgi:hypothetical protein